MFFFRNLIPVENMPLSKLNYLTSHAQYSEKSAETSFQRNSYETKIEEIVKRMIDKAPSHHNPIENRKYGYVTRGQPRTMSSAASECTEISTKHVQTSSYYSLDQREKSRTSTLGGTDEFSLDVMEVIVQHFTESPTATCWVIHQRHLQKRNKIEKLLNFRRSLIATQANVKINEMYCVFLEGVYYRGKVLYRINNFEVLVLLIDYGRTSSIRISDMTLITQMPRHSNGLAFQINFTTLRNIALNESLRVRNVSVSSDGVMNVQCIEEKKIFTSYSHNDLTVIPLPVDVPLELFCRDFSFVNIDMGYISVCHNDPEKIKSIDGLSQKIGSYLKETKDAAGYSPEVNELCLGYVEDEGQWYRAKCVKEMLSESFKLLMIDYGAVYSVKSENIRKMVKEFMQPSIMHLCAISGKFIFMLIISVVFQMLIFHKVFHGDRTTIL